MYFYPASSLSDGAAEDTSSGFFDADNQPPWDTWVTYEPVSGVERGRILCWVPGSLVSLADAGIEANPEQCIVWVE